MSTLPGILFLILRNPSIWLYKMEKILSVGSRGLCNMTEWTSSSRVIFWGSCCIFRAMLANDSLSQLCLHLGIITLVFYAKVPEVSQRSHVKWGYGAQDLNIFALFFHCTLVPKMCPLSFLYQTQICFLVFLKKSNHMTRIRKKY